MMIKKQFSFGAVIKVFFAIAVILSAAWSLQVMGSAYLRVWGDQCRLNGDRSRAETFYKFSSGIDPQNWWTPLGVGQLYSETRYYELDPEIKQEWARKEQVAFAQAYRHNTKKEEVVYGLGRAELALGHKELGLNYYRQAANYKRFNDFYWRKLGIELRKEGLYEEALEVFVFAQSIDQSNKTVRRNIKWLRDVERGVGE